jgi:hypothetical protein
MVHIAVLLSAPLLRAAVPAFTLLVALLARMPVEHQPDGCCPMRCRSFCKLNAVMVGNSSSCLAT